MSNNKQIEKPLELPHQETIVGTNTIQTKPFDNQKTMSNNKQSSVEFFLYEMFSLLGEFENKALPSYKIMDLFEQAKAMHKEECKESYYESLLSNFQTFEQYYNEKFGGNNEDTN